MVLESALLTPASAQQVVASVKVGTTPYGIAYDSGKGEVFVNRDSDNVSVISDTTNKVVGNASVESNPIGLAYDSGKGEVFSANSGDGTVRGFPTQP